MICFLMAEKEGLHIQEQLWRLHRQFYRFRNDGSTLARCKRPTGAFAYSSGSNPIQYFSVRKQTI